MAARFHLIGCILLVVVFLLEFFIDQREQKHIYQKKEALVNILIGLGMFVISFANRSFIFWVYNLVYSIRLFSFTISWWHWILVVILIDFTYYWYHRCAHSVNWLWAAHAVHHSGEQFNVLVSFRISWANQLSGYFVFNFWLLLLGFDPILIYIASNLVLFYQCWIHTELIDRMPNWFEWIFNSPSHHRVHHGSNLDYLDKNHGGILIIWDRLFGTYQDEVERPTYGLADKPAGDDLNSILWSDWKALFQKVFAAHSVKEAVNYLVQPPGWSPDGHTKTVKQLRLLPKEIDSLL